MEHFRVYDRQTLAFIDGGIVRDYNIDFDFLSNNASTLTLVDETVAKKGDILAIIEGTNKLALGCIISVDNTKKTVSFKHMKIAEYKCEICGEDKLFIKKSDGENYTEPHHLIPISMQGKPEKFGDHQSLDNLANIVSLCSHCHNFLHYGRFADKKPALIMLYRNRIEKLKEADIYISEKDFLDIYK